MISLINWESVVPGKRGVKETPLKRDLFQLSVSQGQFLHYHHHKANLNHHYFTQCNPLGITCLPNLEEDEDYRPAVTTKHIT